jgi:hypothetical protein
MNTSIADNRPTLAQGQLWKVEHGYVQIVDLGRGLVHYRILRQPEQRAAITKIITIEALLNYLRQSEVELVNSPVVA